MIQIPEILKNKDFRFVKIKRRDKAAFEKGWNIEKNYTYDDVELHNHLKEGGNYGIIGGHGNILLVDCDNKEAMNIAKEKLPKTIIVSRLGGIGHLYFLCSNGRNTDLDKNSIHYGEIRAKDRYVVAPGSIHPSGSTYTITEGTEIAEIKMEDLENAFSDYIKIPSIINGNKKYDDTKLGKLRKIHGKLDRLLHGIWEGEYPSRSEAEMAAVTILKQESYGFDDVDNIMENICKIGKWKTKPISYRRTTYDKPAMEIIPEATKNTDPVLDITKLPKDHFIYRYMNMSDTYTDAYPEYAFCCALSMLSIATSRKLKIMIKPNTIYPNLWFMLLGISTISRKSTAINIMDNILKMAKIDIKRMPDSFSMEALMQRLSVDATGYFAIKEFGGFLSTLGKKYNTGTEAFFCELYDNPIHFERKLRKETFDMDDIFINIIGGTIPKSLSKYVPVSDLDSGLMARLMSVWPERKKETRGIETLKDIDEKLQMKLANEIRGLYEFFDNHNEIIKVKIEDDALLVLNSWISTMEEKIQKMENPERFSSVFGRATDYVVKIASLIRLGNTDIINIINTINTLTHSQLKNDTNVACIELTANLRELCELLSVDYKSMITSIYYVNNIFIPYALKVYEFIEQFEDTDKLERVYLIIKRHGIITHSDLLRHSHMKAKDFTEIIETLITSNKVRKYIKDSGKTKPNISYKALAPDNDVMRNFEIRDDVNVNDS